MSFVSERPSTIHKVVTQLNAEFVEREAKAPAQGYRVVFEELPTLTAKLLPMGELRTTENLTGIPKQGQSYDCPFCNTTLKTEKVYKDCRAILSLSGQLLLIPDAHYTHWFTMPIEEQVKLLTHALELRKTYSGTHPRPMELHCGSFFWHPI